MQLNRRVSVQRMLEANASSCGFSTNVVQFALYDLLQQIPRSGE